MRTVGARQSRTARRRATVLPPTDAIGRRAHDFWDDRLGANNPMHSLKIIKKQLEINNYNILKSYKILNYSKRMQIRELTARLAALNPLSILARGYSITRTIPEKIVVKDPGMVALDQDLEVMVARGRLFCRVKGKSTDG